MIIDECKENWQLAGAVFIHCFLTLSPLSFAPPSIYFLRCFTLSHYSHFSLASFLLKSHFLSHHLSCCPRRLMYAVFITTCLCSFDQQNSSHGLAAAALKPARPILPNRQRRVFIPLHFFHILQ